MSQTIKGRITDFYADGVAIQPNFVLVEKNDGTIEGSVTYECDEQHIGNLPQQKSTHPRDYRCECYNREFTYLPNRKVRMVASYFGLISNKTDGVIAYTPNTNQDPITSHPDFEDFAGTAEAPNTANGATFNTETGEFLGFFNPAVKDLFGAEFYLVPATLLSVTYWQRDVPKLAKRMTRKANIPGFKKPADVKEFLLLDTPYRQVGSFYQVTEQWMGSGPNGFSTIIYPNA